MTSRSRARRGRERPAWHPVSGVLELPHDLRSRLDGLSDPFADPAPFRAAAVLAPLLPASAPDEGPRLLLIERASDLRAHAGQIAFPGGKPEASDRDLLDTALREAWEEVALPRERVRVIGRLQPVPVPTGFLVFPFVGIVDADFEPRCDAGEVKSVLTPSLRRLADPAVYRHRGTREWQGVHYDLHEFQIHEPPLWGATARMVYDLLGRLGLAPRPGGAGDADERG